MARGYDRRFERDSSQMQWDRGREWRRDEVASTIHRRPNDDGSGRSAGVVDKPWREGISARRGDSREERPWRDSGGGGLQGNGDGDRFSKRPDVSARSGHVAESGFVDRSGRFHPLLSGVLLEREQGRGRDGDLRFKYFQDRHKKWPFWCKADGANLLYRVFSALGPCLNASESAGQRAIREGEELYDRKPNLGGGGVAWSQEEYNHPGLQRQYVRFKSVQRFTETWTALERSYNWGLLSLECFLQWSHKPLRVASLGGGPGFELLAMEIFVKRYLPSRHDNMQLFSLDLEPSWEQYTKLLGLEFAVWDVNDGEGLLRKCPARPARFQKRRLDPSEEVPLDLAIISYVYSHYMGNDHCYDWLADALKTGRIGAVLVCSRHENMMRYVKPMEERGITVISVLQDPHTNDDIIDHRQLLFLTEEQARALERPSKALEVSFPNVPYCEHRQAKR